MKDLTKIALKETIAISILAIIETGVSLLFKSQMAPGILYGSFFAVLMFWLMTRDVYLMCRKERFSRYGFLIRYGLAAVALWTATFYGRFFFVGAAIGFLNLKISLFLFGRWLSENSADKG
ncbi:MULTISPECIES: ATP synthase subunit I [Kosmotoga]|jgi:hypothetical protein|uniref:ATP synthase subunit I n=1 Tax=Kosmotoga TaxID=651456 RepID=UPI0011D09A16|nr:MULTISPECIES: ATP synthase subunit I [Kosmotoga]MDI3524277.1 hypothetical protein [Kosmotoga sp.]MDK2953887.1 hypothetical protein [Kosmotoga sp.]